MANLPVRGDLDGTSGGFNQGVFKTGIGNMRDFIAQLFGTSTDPLRTVYDTFRLNGPGQIENVSLVPSVGGNALTMTIKTKAGAVPSTADPVLVGVRNAVLGTGANNSRAITAATSLTISSGSTMGHRNAVAGRLYWYLIDNAGTPELAVASTNFGPQGIISTTAEGGAGGADDARTMYSATARANVPYRCIGRSLDTQAAAGTWTANPSLIELWPFDQRIGDVVARSSNTMIASQDIGKTFILTGPFTQTFDAVANLGDGFWCELALVSASGAVIVDPNAAETIDGATTITLTHDERVIVVCDGASLSTLGRIRYKPGTMMYWPISTPPAWALTRDGSAISRATYADLFASLMRSLSGVTITIASPGVVTWAAHGLIANDPVKFTTTGGLPTGLVVGTTYFVVGASITTNTFQLSAAAGGAAINTTGTQSGVHTGINAPFGDGDGATTFNLPDDRSNFERGLDLGRGNDANRSMGSEQAHAFTDHTHTTTPNYATSTGGTVGFFAGSPISTAGLGTGGASTGAGTETRPRNRAYLPIIVY